MILDIIATNTRAPAVAIVGAHFYKTKKGARLVFQFISGLHSFVTKQCHRTLAILEGDSSYNPQDQ